MREQILKADPETEFWTSERVFILELSNSEADREVSIARARVEPGVTTQLHRLNGIIERYVVQQGEGEMEVGDEPETSIGPGDVVLVPAGVQQRITNTGNEDLLFLCVCTPPFFADAYESLEPPARASDEDLASSEDSASDDAKAEDSADEVTSHVEPQEAESGDNSADSPSQSRGRKKSV